MHFHNIEYTGGNLLFVFKFDEVGCVTINAYNPLWASFFSFFVLSRLGFCFVLPLLNRCSSSYAYFIHLVLIKSD